MGEAEEQSRQNLFRVKSADALPAKQSADFGTAQRSGAPEHPVAVRVPQAVAQQPWKRVPTTRKLLRSSAQNSPFHSRMHSSPPTLTFEPT